MAGEEKQPIEAPRKEPKESTEKDINITKSLPDENGTMDISEHSHSGTESQMVQYANLDRKPDRAIVFIIDGGGAAITTGIKGDLRIPFACKIIKATLLADQSGSIKVDIWKDSYANFPPTDADTITGGAEPEISAAVKDEDETLVGWNQYINEDDTLRFNVDTVATVEKVTLILDVQPI